MIDTCDECCPDGVRSCRKQGACIIAKSRYRRGRKPPVRLWVQELIVYDTMWRVVQQRRILQDTLDLGYQGLKWSCFYGTA